MSRFSRVPLLPVLPYVLRFEDLAGKLAEMASRSPRSGATVKLRQEEFHTRQSFSPGIFTNHRQVLERIIFTPLLVNKPVTEEPLLSANLVQVHGYRKKNSHHQKSNNVRSFISILTKLHPHYNKAMCSTSTNFQVSG